MLLTEKTAWVTNAVIEAVPLCHSNSVALQRVSPVSTMSSIKIQFLPFTSSLSPLIKHSPLGSLALFGTKSSQFKILATPFARKMPPASGDITTLLGTCSTNCSNNEATSRFRIGISKYPSVRLECRSTVISLSIPEA
jgi:hypothetical protein